MDDTISRNAVRALLVRRGDHRLLLIRMRVPDSQRVIWLTPGGGVEPGESDEQALTREVFEETGHSITAHDGLVWRRRARFRLHGRDWDQSEQYFLIFTDPFTPVFDGNPATQERDALVDWRWWSVQEIAAATDETFVPLDLAAHFKVLLSEGVPPAPIEVGY